MSTTQLNPIAEDVRHSPLRQLRLWHWQQALHFRTQAKLERTYVSCDKPGLRLAVSALSDARADFHIRAVQALNDTAECEGSTAEMDAESWQL